VDRGLKPSPEPTTTGNAASSPTCANTAPPADNKHLCASSTYPSLRRYSVLPHHSNAPFLFDLAEVILRCPVPAAVYRTATWQTLLSGSSDVTAWCNDLMSVAKDSAGRDR
jgi:hypothetical protein